MENSNKNANIYLMLTNTDKEKCIILTPNVLPQTEPENPELLYDGKENAILYRNNNESIVIDKIPENQRQDLLNLKEILIVEFDTANNKPNKEYIAQITKTDNLEKIIN